MTDLKPDQEPKQLAHELASHFPLITNASAALIPGNIPTSTNTGSNFTRLVTSKQVENHTKGFKIPNSRVEGDIPKHLIKPLAKHLAIPLSEIYNESFVNESWPLVWKVETVIPIPKTLSPGGFHDIRPISMTTLWSKIMKSFVAGFTYLETKDNWKRNQHGGKKVLTIMWDSILESVEPRTSNGSHTAVLCGVDFSKSFSRCSHQEILGA